MASTYTVQSGDSLTAIAVKVGLASQPADNSAVGWAPAIAAAQRIAAANGISDINKISVGQELAIPDDAAAAAQAVVAGGNAAAQQVLVATGYAVKPTSSSSGGKLGAGAIFVGLGALALFFIFSKRSARHHSFADLHDVDDMEES